MFTNEALSELIPLLERSKLYRYQGGKWIINTSSQEDFDRLVHGFHFDDDERGGVGVEVGIRVSTDIPYTFMRGETKWFDANLPVEMWPVCDDLRETVSV